MGGWKGGEFGVEGWEMGSCGGGGCPAVGVSWGEERMEGHFWVGRMEGDPSMGIFGWAGWKGIHPWAFLGGGQDGRRSICGHFWLEDRMEGDPSLGIFGWAGWKEIHPWAFLGGQDGRRSIHGHFWVGRMEGDPSLGLSWVEDRMEGDPSMGLSWVEDRMEGDPSMGLSWVEDRMEGHFWVDRMEGDPSLGIFGWTGWN